MKQADPKRLAADTLADLDRARSTVERLSAALEGGVEPAVNPLLKDASDPASWLAAHRPGKPSKIDADAALRAFILARIDHMTFDQLVAAVAARFPPERRTSRSALSRWWRRNRPAISAQSTG